MDNKKAYIIMESHGAYELDYVAPVGVCYSRESAEKHRSELENNYERIRNLATRSDDFVGDLRPYNVLINGFMDYVYNKLFPDVSDYTTLSNEEDKKAEDLIGDFDTDEFKRYCRVVCGMSDEVIEATIIYKKNKWDHTTVRYYIQESDVLD